MGSDPAAEALQELGSEQGKGAVADACPTPRRVPPAQLPPGFALQTPQPRQQPPVKLRVVELRSSGSEDAPSASPQHLGMFKFASKGCQGLFWMELEQREAGPLHPLQAAWQGHRRSAGAREVEGSAVKKPSSVFVQLQVLA